MKGEAVSGSTILKAIGGIIALVGLWQALVPYVGPTFGYPMPPGSDVPAWEWSASHTQRHLLPGIAAMIAGGLLWGRGRRTVLAGSWLALAAGTWFVISPFVVRAWLESGGGGGRASTAMQIITPLGYHYVPGLITVGLAAFLLGWLAPERRRAEAVPRAAPAADTTGRKRQPVAVP